MKNSDFSKLVTECHENNLLGKRKRDTRLEVVEDAITALELKGDAAILMPLVVEELEAQKAKAAPKKAKADNKPAATTQGGYTQTQNELIPVETDFDVAIITSAQNNTVTTGAEQELLKLCDDLRSQGFTPRLFVLPIFYNKHAFSAAVETEEEYFTPVVMPYMQFDDCWLWEAGAVKLNATAAVLPTAKLPINNAKRLNGGELCSIVGSPKQQYETLPRLNDSSIRKAATTGAVTGYNYIRGSAGALGEKDHVQGAIVAYKCGNGEYNVTNVRQATDGSMNLMLPEIDYKYGSLPVSGKLGDLHSEVFDREYWRKTLNFINGFGQSLTSLAVDDILHFSTRSHHNRNSGKHLYASRGESVAGDLQKVTEQLNELAALVPNVYVTESNHNSAIDNWLDDSGVQIKYDSHNSKIYYLLNWLVCDTLDQGEKGKNALQIALENADLAKLEPLAENVTFGRMDEPERPYKYDYSQHGHKGANGSAGSPNQFKDWNLYLITGHTHSPRIIGSVFTTGVTARLNQGYNRGGASSWDHGHVFEFGNGECQLLTLNPQPVSRTFLLN